MGVQSARPSLQTLDYLIYPPAMREATTTRDLPTLRELRLRRGLTLEAVTVLSGDDSLDPATISRIERGLVDARPATIVRLARALGISARRMRAICEHTAQVAEEREGPGRP
jgi:transcriptional regulator with XRE-family HTH domain